MVEIETNSIKTQTECKDNKEKETKENDMIVYFTSKYERSTNEKGQIVVNNFYVINKLGQGSYWTAYKVKRNYISGDFVDDKYYIFKEGLLSIKDDEISYNLMMLSSEEKQQMTMEELEIRLGVREFNILRFINNVNIARLYEAIIDLDKNIIVFVMEFCDLGTLMDINDEETRFVYNWKLFLKALEYKIITETDFEDSEFNKENIEEYIKSETNLFDKNQKLMVKLTIFFFTQLARALDHLHNDHIIAHRDLKVDNIVLKDNFETKSIDLKLIDFSISRKMKSQDEMLESTSCTQIFKPPEMEEDYQVNPFKVDIFQFGTTLFCFLFNWKEDTIWTEEAQKNELDKLKKSSQALYEIIISCWKQNPLERPNIKEILEKLEQ